MLVIVAAVMASVMTLALVMVRLARGLVILMPARVLLAAMMVAIRWPAMVCAVNHSAVPDDAMDLVLSTTSPKLLAASTGLARVSDANKDEEKSGYRGNYRRADRCFFHEK